MFVELKLSSHGVQICIIVRLALEVAYLVPACHQGTNNILTYIKAIWFGAPSRVSRHSFRVSTRLLHRPQSVNISYMLVSSIYFIDLK